MVFTKEIKFSSELTTIVRSKEFAFFSYLILHKNFESFEFWNAYDFSLRKVTQHILVKSSINNMK